jgi:predicted  nucleic acid-binding Zn-ribbon protein
MQHKNNIISIFAIILLVCIFLSPSLNLFANQLKITTSPNPCFTGEKVRFTVQSPIPVKKSSIVISSKYKLDLQKIDQNLYTASFIIPKKYQVGLHNAKLYINTPDNQYLMFRFQYEVVPQTSLSAHASAQDLATKQTKSMKNAELSLKVDDLENSVNKLKYRNKRLTNKINKLKQNLKNAKKQKNHKKSIDDINKKEQELKKLEQQLRQQNQHLAQKTSQLKQQLRKLADLEKSIKAQKAALSKKEEELMRQQDLLAAQKQQVSQKSNSLNQMEHNLLKQLQSLDAQNKTISQEQAHISKLKKNLHNQAQTLSHKEHKIAHIENKLSHKEQALLHKEKQLSSQKENLHQEKQDIQNKLAKIYQKQKLLSYTKQAISQKENELSNRETKLNHQEHKLITLKQTLAHKSENLSAKENKLAHLSSQLAYQSKLVSTKTKTLENKESRIKFQAQELTSLQNNLNNKEKNLSTLQSSLSQKEHTLSQKEHTLQNKNQKLVQKQNELQLKNQSLAQKQTRLHKQERLLSHAQNKFQKIKTRQLITQSKLDKKSAEQAKKEQDLIKLSQSINESKNTIVKTKDTIKSYRQEINKKHKETKEMRDWISSKTDRLISTYQSARNSKINNFSDYKNHYTKLDSLSSLLAKQASELKKINYQLYSKNELLTDTIYDIENSIKPTYQHAFSPYIGVHIFHPDRALDTGTEVGCQFIEYLKEDISVALRLGFISTRAKQTKYKNGTAALFVTTYGLDLSKHIFDINENTKLNIDLGLGGDFNQDTSFGLSFGMHILFDIDSESASTFLYKNRKDNLAAFAFIKKLKLFNPLDQKIKQKIAQATYQPDALAPKVFFNAPSQRIQYLKPTYRLRDIDKHWAKDAINALYSLGIINGKNDSQIPDAITYIFDPKANVTRAEAIKMIVLTTHLSKIINKALTSIDYFILNNTDTIYHVSLYLEDENGNIIKNILTNQSQLPGKYTITWDGTDNEQNLVKPGNYNFVFQIAHNDVFLARKSEPITISTQSDFAFKFQQAPELTFADVPQNHWSKNYLNEASSMKIYSFQNKSFFYPGLEINRIEFIRTLSKALAYLGYETNAIIDLTIYNDFNLIPSYAKNDLKRYISALGYGGDDKGNLNPYDNLTRAEAATLLNRFLKWYSNRNKVSMSF